MTTVADFVREFMARAARGERPVARVKEKHAATLVAMLVREGVGIAQGCLEAIRDPEARRVVETILFAAAGGAALGATIATVVAGSAAAPVGAAIGAGIGAVAGIVAVVVTLQFDATRGELVVAVS